MQTSTTTMVPVARPISGREYDGYPVEQWRAAAIRAQNALTANPDDSEAREQLVMALDVLYEHADAVRAAMERANTREATSLMEARAAERPTGAEVFGANLADAVSFGLGGELSALGAMVPGGLSPSQAMRRYDEAMADINASGQPGAAVLGSALGAILPGVGMARALPAAGRAIVAGSRLGGPLSLANPRYRAMLAAGGIAGTEGALYGLAGEGSVRERVEQAATLAPIGALVGAAGTGAVNWMIRRSKAAIAREGAQALAPERARADVRFHEERAEQAALERRVRAATAPERITQTQARTQIVQAQVEDLPAVRQSARQRREAALAREQARREAAPHLQAQREARTTDIPLRRQMLEDQATILRFRAERVRAMQRGMAPRPQGDGGRGTTEEYRAWLMQNGATPEAAEATIQRTIARYGPRAFDPAPGGAVAAPPPPPIQSTVPPAQMGHTPDDAARTAYAQVFAATGDAAQARQAAARAGGMARAAPAPAETASLSILEFAQAEPTMQSAARLQQYLNGLPSAQSRQRAVQQLRTINPGWDEILRSIGF